MSGQHACSTDISKAVGWIAEVVNIYVGWHACSAAFIFKAVGWIAQSGKNIVSQQHMQFRKYYIAIGWIAQSSKNIYVGPHYTYSAHDIPANTTICATVGTYGNIAL